MTKTEAIRQFLLSTGNHHLTSLYNPNMEVQVNVAKDDGERISEVYMGRRWNGWKKGDEVWKSFRIPWNADSEPQFEDRELKFSLAAHAEGIGMTGWDWVNRQSLWVGFDFDSIANHKSGLSSEELDELRSAVSVIPWITLVKSTSGKGLHLYIHFDSPVPTSNHTEHAGLARSLLSVLTLETGFNFHSSVDVCGGILWCFHRKQEGTDGLSLLKEGTKFPVSKIPANWRDHISVTAKRTKKVKPVSKNSSQFEELVASMRFITLDEEHKRLLKFLSEKADRDFWWDNDHNMLVCHTFDLAKAHKELGLKGIFYTNSTGSSSQNCFAFPNPGGAWTVRRHGIGCKEHPSWVTDPSGWTRCVFNAPAEYESAVRSNKGVRNAKGDYIFLNHLDGIKAIQQMGIDFELPESLKTPQRELVLKEKDDILIVSITRASIDSQPEGFLSNAKNTHWEICLEKPKVKKDYLAPDNLIRHAISQQVEAGWFIFVKNSWVLQSKSNVYTVLMGQNELSKGDVEIMMSKAILSPWEIVNYPFADEYPGDRLWNKDAARLKITPSEGPCDAWLSVFDHCGKALDDVVKDDPWCQQAGIKTGGEYLLVWFSSLFQKPTEPLPYLFFVGEQNTGKSTLHEAVGQFLFKKGYVRADHALVNPSGFNEEVANAVLCIVEETDLRQNKEAANRLKDWVTGRTISINAKYKTVYDIQNSTHWIQCANDANYCPVLSGDTRVLVIRVDRPEREIPKERLFSMLENEAPAFLHLLLQIDLPESNGRLAVPCLTTLEKKEMELSNKNEVEVFVAEQCYERKGHEIPFDLFYNNFQAWLPADRRAYWSSNKVSRYFPRTGLLCKGKVGKENLTVVGNITFDSTAEDKDFYYKVNAANGRLEVVK